MRNNTTGRTGRRLTKKTFSEKICVFIVKAQGQHHGLSLPQNNLFHFLWLYVSICTSDRCKESHIFDLPMLLNRVNPDEDACRQ